MNPNNFKGYFKNFAKPTRFEVEGFGMPEGLRFAVKAASIPGTNVGTIEVPYQGRKLKYAGDRTYQPWTITVINGIDYDIHNEFLKWQALLNDPVSNLGVDPIAYKRDGKVIQLDEGENSIKEFEFYGAFPQEVSPIELSWENNDAVEEFTVTLEYDLHV